MPGPFAAAIHSKMAGASIVSEKNNRFFAQSPRAFLVQGCWSSRKFLFTCVICLTTGTENAAISRLRTFPNYKMPYGLQLSAQFGSQLRNVQFGNEWAVLSLSLSTRSWCSQISYIEQNFWRFAPRFSYGDNNTKSFPTFLNCFWWKLSHRNLNMVRGALIFCKFCVIHVKYIWIIARF